MHQNSNHIISECSRLAQKEYKTIHDWVGKVVPWELRKKFKFDKWFMRNPASVLENETHKLLLNFDIQTDHLISARRQDLIIIKKKKKKETKEKKENLQNVDFAVSTDHRVKLKESQKRDKYLNLARELKKTEEHENDVYTNCNWCSWYSHRKICTRTLK